MRTVRHPSSAVVRFIRSLALRIGFGAFFALSGAACLVPPPPGSAPSTIAFDASISVGRMIEVESGSALAEAIQKLSAKGKGPDVRKATVSGGTVH